MKLLQEFKTFAIRGNAIDMMVGIVVGAGFTAIVNSFVKDILSPPLGILTGESGFASKEVIIRGATETAEAVTITYGQFITELINFILVAFVVFFFIKLINFWQERDAAEETDTPTTKKCRYCFTEISKKAKRCPNCTSKNP